MTTETRSKAPTVWSNIANYLKLVSESRIATIGLAMVLFWIIVGLTSFVWTPQDPNASLGIPNRGIQDGFMLGTDRIGRDNLSRTMAGTQVILMKTRIPELSVGAYLLGIAGISAIVLGLVALPWASDKRTRQKGFIGLIIAAVLIPIANIIANSTGLNDIIIPKFAIPVGVAIWGVAGSLTLGSTLGLIAGYRGGTWDQVIMQILDALIAFPRIVLYLVVITALGQGDLVMIFAIAVTGAPGVARLARSQALEIKSRDYIRAAETRGESIWYIMFREILPNAIGPLLVDAMLRVGYAVFTIGTLGFLGRGLPPPEPDWGNMINLARPSFGQAPLSVLVPAFAIVTLVVGLNLFADGLNEEITRYQK